MAAYTILTPALATPGAQLGDYGYEREGLGTLALDGRRPAPVLSAPRPFATSRPTPPMELQKLIRTATERPLTQEEAGSAFDEIMEGRATPVQIAALLVGIRVRGATPQEVAA